MRRRNLRLAIANLSAAAWNRVAKLGRQMTHQIRRAFKGVRENAKSVRASARGTVDAGRDLRTHTYVGAVRTARYWGRIHQQTMPRLGREIAVRRQLRVAAAGDGPVIVGPWLSEVGYEVL